MFSKKLPRIKSKKCINIYIIRRRQKFKCVLKGRKFLKMGEWMKIMNALLLFIISFFFDSFFSFFGNA